MPHPKAHEALCDLPGRILPDGWGFSFSAGWWRREERPLVSGYTKLFSDIVESSIWNEPPDTCKVWVTLLALCDQDGYVRGSVGWLAGKARVSREKAEAAIQLFQKPDPESRTPDHDGRRIEQLDDGWLVLNYIAFRDRLSNNPKATATRIRVQKHRERYRALRNAESVTTPVSASASVSVILEEGECKGGWTLDQCKAAAATIGMPDAMVEAFFNHYDRVGWVIGDGKTKLVKLSSALSKWKADQQNRLPATGKRTGRFHSL